MAWTNPDGSTSGQAVIKRPPCVVKRTKKRKSEWKMVTVTPRDTKESPSNPPRKIKEANKSRVWNKSRAPQARKAWGSSEQTSRTMDGAEGQGTGTEDGHESRDSQKAVELCVFIIIKLRNKNERLFYTVLSCQFFFIPLKNQWVIKKTLQR